MSRWGPVYLKLGGGWSWEEGGGGDGGDEWLTGDDGDIVGSATGRHWCRTSAWNSEAPQAGANGNVQLQARGLSHVQRRHNACCCQDPVAVVPYEIAVERRYAITKKWRYTRILGADGIAHMKEGRAKDGGQNSHVFMR